MNQLIAECQVLCGVPHHGACFTLSPYPAMEVYVNLNCEHAMQIDVCSGVSHLNYI